MPAPRSTWKAPRHPDVARAVGLLRRAVPAQGEVGPAVVVACSGGADSVALLGLLHTLAPSAGWRLTVAHIDHGLRADSAHDAQAVTSLAARLGLPVRHERLALAAGPGLAGRARHARLQALIRIAHAAGTHTIALGHTQTDQAETVLLHLARGAGLRGLSGMRTTTPWAATGHDGDGYWWRPLLELSRAQSRALAQRLDLAFVDDPTNADRDKPRTRIRHEVLPRLAAINPDVAAAMATAAGHAARADDALAQWVASEVQRRRRDPGLARPDAAHGQPDRPAAARVYDISDVATLPAEVRWRLIRAVCSEAGLPVDAIRARVVADIDAAMCGTSQTRSWDLHPRTRAHVAGGRFWVAPHDASTPGPSGGLGATFDPPRSEG